MGEVVQFPSRRICALGLPREIVGDVRRQLNAVAVSTNASALRGSDMLLIGDGEKQAVDIIQSIRRTRPHLPILYWSERIRTATLIEHCRTILF